MFVISESWLLKGVTECSNATDISVMKTTVRFRIPFLNEQYDSKTEQKTSAWSLQQREEDNVNIYPFFLVWEQPPSSHL